MADPERARSVVVLRKCGKVGILTGRLRLLTAHEPPSEAVGGHVPVNIESSEIESEIVPWRYRPSAAEIIISSLTQSSRSNVSGFSKVVLDCRIFRLFKLPGIRF